MNHGPLDLQSNALPLSYSPFIFEHGPIAIHFFNEIIGKNVYKKKVIGSMSLRIIWVVFRFRCNNLFPLQSFVSEIVAENVAK